MPHASDVQPTSHDRHDTMLVAALAAGDLAGNDRDLAGNDRDLALDLTAACPECSSLRADLLAIARATAVVPPPVVAVARDFRLTPADAARLRPAPWRRLGGWLRTPQQSVFRPLGLGLTTLGLVGLLIGNVQVPLSGPVEGARPGGAAMEDSGFRAAGSDAAPLSAASAGPGTAAVAGPAATVAPAPTMVDGQGSAAPELAPSHPAVAALPGDAQASSGGETGGNGPAASGRDSAGEVAIDQDVAPSGQPFQPLNLLFVGAVVFGLGLLVASRLRARPGV